jgi:predicted helicase
VKKGMAHGAKNSQLSTLNSAFIYYHDIGDYLNREEKLARIHTFGSMINVPLTELTPNEHGDWISLRNEGFDQFITLGDKENKDNSQTFFAPIYSNGLKTQRDAWCYNSSTTTLKNKLHMSIEFYNEQLSLFSLKKTPNINPIDFVMYDSRKISWTTSVLEDLSKQKSIPFHENSIVPSMYNTYASLGSSLGRWRRIDTPKCQNRSINRHF